MRQLIILGFIHSPQSAIIFFPVTEETKLHANSPGLIFAKSPRALILETINIDPDSCSYYRLNLPVLR